MIADTFHIEQKAAEGEPTVECLPHVRSYRVNYPDGRFGPIGSIQIDYVTADTYTHHRDLLLDALDRIAQHMAGPKP